MNRITFEVAIPIVVCGDVRFGRRSGTTSFEALVAFSLLTTVLAIFAPLVVRHDRLLMTHRHYRLALDELSNQLERLTALPPAELSQALAQLKLTPFAADRLHGAELRGEMTPADVGQRLTLRLTWDEPGRKAAPVSLAAWILPDSRRLPGAERAREGL